MTSPTVTATLPAWCAEYIGLPYRERGRTRDGLDCWGLIRLVLAEQAGVTVESYVDGYRGERDLVRIAQLFFEEATSSSWRQVPLDTAQVFDVLELALAGRHHVGLVVAPGRMLHVLAGRETCIERLHPIWARRIEAAYRHTTLS
jgi:cell wall-associated NlpC family hydrolase